MRYYANPSTALVREAMAQGHLGLIKTPAQRQDTTAQYWCADNGCFGKGYPGDVPWLAWLESHTAEAPSCAFATAPDVVADHQATLERSAPWLPRIRALGFPAAWVAQDGATVTTVPWPSFDVLFIGGSTEWKLGPQARALAAAALDRLIPCHMGRVNSLRRLMYASAIGCSSVDGTYLTYGPDVNLPRLLGWLSFHADNPPLMGWNHA